MSSTPVLLGLTKTNLREQALASLRTAITSGQLAPGTQMVETELSEQLGISRGTLREAMRQLQQEGLLVARTRGRLYVRRVDKGEIRDIFVVRASLEALAAGLLADRSDRTAVVDHLHATLAQMTLAAEKQDLEGRIESDLSFHREMCRLTGNETLLHSWQGLEGVIRMSIMFAGRERAVGNMNAPRHTAIVDAIASGDRDRAQRAVSEHMQWAADNLTD